MSVKAYEYVEQQVPDWSRIDMLLAAYDGTIERIEKVIELWDTDRNAAAPLLVRAQQILLHLYAGVDLRHGEIPENMQKLYLFVFQCLASDQTDDMQAGVDVLKKIREGLVSIRDEAAEMEADGKLHPVDHNLHQLSQVG